MISVHFQGKAFNISVIQVYVPTSNAEEAEVELQVYEVGLWRPTRPSRTNTQKRCLFHYRGLECKSRKSRNTWSNRQIWPWSTEWSRAKAFKSFPKRTPSSNNKREDSTCEYHQMVNTKIRLIIFSSVQWLMSDSLWPHEPRYTRPPCPSPNPGVQPNPWPLSWWCHPTISSSVILFSSCPQTFPATRSFQKSQLFATGGQSIGVSASTSVLSRTPRLISFRMGWSQSWWSSIQSAETRPGAGCGSDHELPIAKFRFKLKKGKITRPFRYDLNQIPYNYTVEVTDSRG